MKARTVRLRSAPRRRRRGVTLIEAMASAAIVGVGVMSLAHVMFFAEDGISVSKKRASALEMARQRVEWLSTIPTDQMPQCLSVGGCRLDPTTYTAPKSAAGSYACSELLTGMSMSAPGTSSAQTGNYRIDTSIEPHPDPDQISGAQILRVHVCWAEGDGIVQEVQAQKLLVPEV